MQLVSGKTVLMKLPVKYSITPSEKAISEIEELVGEDSIWLHIKDKVRQTFESRRGH
jgi:hypothetical protein